MGIERSRNMKVRARAIKNDLLRYMELRSLLVKLRGVTSFLMLLRFISTAFLMPMGMYIHFEGSQHCVVTEMAGCYIYHHISCVLFLGTEFELVLPGGIVDCTGSGDVLVFHTY